MRKFSFVFGLVLATVVSSASAGLQTQANCLTFDYYKWVRNSGYESTSCNVTVPYFDTTQVGTLSSSASSNYGVLKAVSSSSGPTYGGMSTNASAAFQDSITISSAGMTGKTGIATFLFDLSWIQTSTTGEMGWVEMVMRFDASAKTNQGTSVLSTRQTRYTTTDGSEYGAWNNDLAVDFDQPITLTVPFTFDIPFTVGMTLATHVYGATEWTALLDAGNSAYWAGVHSIQSDGVLATPFTIVGASGTNYNQSFVPSAQVPEPNTVGLLTLGALLALNGRVRRRNKCM